MSVEASAPKFKLPGLKAIGIGVAAVLGVLILAIVLFFVFFPKQLAAAEAERRIEEATERQLTLGDNIDITFFPALGFSVDQATLSNPDFEAVARGGTEAAEAPFIAADRIVFAVKVMPLLRGAIEVKELIFEGAEGQSARRGRWRRQQLDLPDRRYARRSNHARRSASRRRAHDRQHDHLPRRRRRAAGAE
jgi:uncharacterized protein involved in outer membrane biogenesis